MNFFSSTFTFNSKLRAVHYKVPTRQIELTLTFNLLDCYLRPNFCFVNFFSITTSTFLSIRNCMQYTTKFLHDRLNWRSPNEHIHNYVCAILVLTTSYKSALVESYVVNEIRCIILYTLSNLSSSYCDCILWFLQKCIRMNRLRNNSNKWELVFVIRQFINIFIDD